MVAAEFFRNYDRTACHDRGAQSNDRSVDVEKRARREPDITGLQPMAHPDVISSPGHLFGVQNDAFRLSGGSRSQKADRAGYGIDVCAAIIQRALDHTLTV